MLWLGLKLCLLSRFHALLSFGTHLCHPCLGRKKQLRPDLVYPLLLGLEEGCHFRLDQGGIWCFTIEGLIDGEMMVSGIVFG